MLRFDNIKNCYGISGNYTISNIEFNRDENKGKYNHIIFGINMSGKTSLVKVLKSLKNNTSIKNILKDDGRPSVEITFNGQKYKYDNGWDRKFEEQMFICDKNFLNNSIAVIEKDAFIGVDVTKLIQVEESLNKNLVSASDVKRFIDKNFSIKNQKDCRGYLSDINFEWFFKQKNAHIDAVLSFNEKYMNSKGIKLLSDQDYLDSFDMFKSSKVDLDFIDEYLHGILQNIEKVILKYKINTHDDQSFFQELLNYLEHNKPDDCPVCLREFEQDFGLDEIKEEIKLSINNYNRDANGIKFMDELNKLKNGKNLIQKKLYRFLSKVKEVESLNEIIQEWPFLKNKLKEVYDTFPIYVGKILKLEFGTYIDNYIKFSKQKSELIKNIREVEGSVLLDNFKKLKDDLSLDFLKDIVAELDPQSSLIKIKLQKTEIAIDAYHRDNSSEGEKSLLSLLFFFAYIKTITDQKKTTVLIFDDPIDSHDNYNKHFIIDMIMRNISDLNVVSLILTHSSDVMRSVKMNYASITNFYMMSNESHDLVFKLNNDSLAVFNGVFPFFKQVYSKKGNNIYLDMVSMLPIFRDIIEHAKILNKGEDNINDFAKLYKDISNKFLHFNSEDKSHSLDQLFNIYKTHVKNFPYNNNEIYENRSVVTMNIIQFIIHRRKYQKPHVSNLVENIKFKNILGLYLRWKIESIIYHCTLERIESKIHSNFKSDFIKRKTVNQKINKIKKSYYASVNENNKKELNRLFDSINRYKHIANDFHHQINTYITPILETSLRSLLSMCDDIDELEIKYRKTTNQSP